MFNLRSDILGAWFQGFSAKEIAEDQGVELVTVQEIIVAYRCREYRLIKEESRMG